MQRFRSTWMALMVGVFLVTLSVSAAFGAAPAATRDAARGQTIASFVHELVFGGGSTDAPDEELIEEDEDNLLESDELVTELDPDSDELVGEESSAHGQCVSEVAQDPEAIGGENENHGGAVSEAARETCWETDDPDADIDPEVDDSHGACVSAVAQDPEAIGGPNDNHGGAVSEAARETCREGDEDEANGDDPESDLDSGDASASGNEDKPRAARGSGKPSWAGTGNGGNGKPSWAGNGQGGGNGRGGGRP